MLRTIPENKILFLDIETVPGWKNWAEVPENMQELFDKKTQRQRPEDMSTEDWFKERGGILSEFGKIICISCGIITSGNKIKLTSFYGHDEEKLLREFTKTISGPYFESGLILCAHNGKEFDFPYIARRMLIHGLELPDALNLHGKKPWQIPHLDTMELWKFGDYKHYTSLNLLAAIFGIPSPKDDIDGSQVAAVYYEEENLERIKIYCEKDVITLAQIFRKFKNEPLLERLEEA